MMPLVCRSTGETPVQGLLALGDAGDALPSCLHMDPIFCSNKSRSFSLAFCHQHLLLQRCPGPAGWAGGVVTHSCVPRGCSFPVCEPDWHHHSLSHGLSWHCRGWRRYHQPFSSSFSAEPGVNGTSIVASTCFSCRDLSCCWVPGLVGPLLGPVFPVLGQPLLLVPAPVPRVIPSDLLQPCSFNSLLLSSPPPLEPSLLCPQFGSLAEHFIPIPP